MSPPPALQEAADAAFLPPAVAKPVRRDSVYPAVMLIVASTVFFSAGDVAAKFMTDTLPPVEVTWLRYAVFAVLMLPAAFTGGGVVTARPGLQVLRAMAVVLSSLFFMLGLGGLPVAEATAINFMSPVFITALSIPLLGEKVGIRRWAAAALGFVGVLMVVRPGSSAFQSAALFPMGSALVWAFAAIATRMMSDERPETTLAWSAVIGFLLLSAAVPFRWVTPDAGELVLAVLTGVGSTAGHWLLVQAFRRAPASVLAPFSYVQLVFASLFGYLAFGAMPGAMTFAGGAVIAASGLYTAHRERVRAKESAK